MASGLLEYPMQTNYNRKGMKQMDEMQKAFYEVMHKYEKSFGEKGVTAILNDWRYAKAGLATIMRFSRGAKSVF